MASGWNMADLWEAIAERQPDAIAVRQGRMQMSWQYLDRTAAALARSFLNAGLTHQSKVGLHLYNSSAYVAGTYAAYKAGMVPFNVNYRYAASELRHLYDNADCEAALFHASFAPAIDQIRLSLGVKIWICVGEEGYPIPDWAVDYDVIIADTPRGSTVKGPWGRGGDDLLLLFTGGTTGLPKGVMWTQNDWMDVLSFTPPDAGIATRDAVEAHADLLTRPDALRPVRLTVSPLMHGAGSGGMMRALSDAGTCVLLPSRRFNAEEMWGEVERLSVNVIGIVGQAFATPMLEALDGAPGRWNLSSVEQISSTGSMWSLENKQGLLRHMPGAVLFDSFSSSEAPGMGRSESTSAAPVATAKFMIGDDTAVFSEDGRRIAPGSPEPGLVALGKGIPLGYYKDPEKTARTFPVIEGRRWCLPGDWAHVLADGSLELLGRGSVCINTGGEKVFPEEVEEVLKRHPDIRDAIVVGLPDPRFGERICAVVEWIEGRGPADLATLKAFAAQQLSDYKMPRDLVALPSVGRGPNGKADYKATRECAAAAIAARSPARPG